MDANQVTGGRPWLLYVAAGGAALGALFLLTRNSGGSGNADAKNAAELAGRANIAAASVQDDIRTGFNNTNEQLHNLSVDWLEAIQELEGLNSDIETQFSTETAAAARRTAQLANLVTAQTNFYTLNERANAEAFSKYKKAKDVAKRQAYISTYPGLSAARATLDALVNDIEDAADVALGGD